MRLRRITQHIKDQNWFAVFLDFFIVVAGILIAFQITNWNEARSDKATEVEYLIQLNNDLSAIRLQAQDQIDFAIGIHSAATKLIDAIDEPPSKERREHLLQVISELADRKSLVIHSPTFEDLQGSGKLSLITDRDLRTEIINGFALMRRSEFIIEKNNESFADGGFTKFVRDDVGLPYRRPTSHPVDAKFHDPRLLSERYTGLMESSTHEFWDRLVQQSGYRVAIAGANHLRAKRVLDSAAELQDNISTYLEESR